MSAKDLAYTVTKYAQRGGWSHRDLLRLSHAKTTDKAVNDVLHYAVKGWSSIGDEVPQEAHLKYLWAVEKAKRATTSKEIVQLIADYNLPRECIPTVWLKEKAVWAALLEKMPMTALIRNLATLSRVGLLTPMSEAGRKVVDQLGNEEALRKARVHPIQLLSAYKVYSSGSGYLSRGEDFTPLPQITQALQDAFYTSFGLVEPSGKRTLLGLDTSSSMGKGTIAGVPGLTPREAAAVMSMVTVRSEWSDGAVKYPLYHAVNFTTTVQEFPITPTDTLEEVTERMRLQRLGGTDCAAPMFYALDNSIPVDTFIVYTDSETWAGRRGHPSEALDQYRKKMGINAKLIVVAFTSTGFTIARPGDAGMLDVVGFDTATPALISEFSRGNI
jgi:60 kDa SS-A/Ro ribonucleoprotein